MVDNVDIELTMIKVGFLPVAVPNISINRNDKTAILRIYIG